MIAIRDEIARVERGEWPADDNPLRHAPHPADDCSATTGRVHIPGAMAPTRRAGRSGDKYWPPVSRIDQAYGDRNVMCTCPPLEAYTDDVTAEPATT